ncbi:MAG TPA: ABC transporter substrate-binding protein, partial [Bacillales bacterium]
MLNRKKSRGNSFLFLSIILALAVVLSGCGGSSDGESAGSSDGKTSGDEKASGKTVEDAMGHKVTIPANPERVLGSYLEDPLIALGVKPVAQWSVNNGIQYYLQSHLEGVPKINYKLPPEAVLKYNPDFIIIGSQSLVQNGKYQQYSDIAPTYVLGNEVTQDWRKTLLKIGKLLGKKDKAKELLAKYEKMAKKEKKKLQKAIGDKS